MWQIIVFQWRFTPETCHLRGYCGFYRAINVGNRVKEDVIVDIVRNMTEIVVEGWLSEDLLRRDVSILVGILTNCTGLV